MANRIRQHRPAYFSGFENATVDFDGVEALLAIPFVAGFADNAKFHRFSQSLGDGVKLMAEYNGGTEGWVVGFLDQPIDALPVWRRKVVFRTKRG